MNDGKNEMGKSSTKDLLFWYPYVLVRTKSYKDRKDICSDVVFVNYKNLEVLPLIIGSA